MDVICGNIANVAFVAMAEVVSFFHFLQKIQRRTQQAVAHHLTLGTWAVKAKTVCGFDETELPRAKIFRRQHFCPVIHSVKAQAAEILD